MTVKDRVAQKFTSGQFWLTIISGLTFAYTSWKKILPPEAIVAILVMVFEAYFKRDRTKDIQEQYGQTK